MNGRNRADGTNELEERLNQYIVSERNKAVSDLADDEQISAEVLNLYIKEYDYLQKNSLKLYKGIEREASRSYQNPKGFDENNGKIA